MPIWEQRHASMFRVTVSADGSTLTQPKPSDTTWDKNSCGMWVLIDEIGFYDNMRGRFRVVMQGNNATYAAVGLIGWSERSFDLSQDYGSDFTRFPRLIMAGNGVYEFDITMSRRRCTVKSPGGGLVVFERLPSTVYLACSMKHGGTCRVEPLA